MIEHKQTTPARPIISMIRYVARRKFVETDDFGADNKHKKNADDK